MRARGVLLLLLLCVCVCVVRVAGRTRRWRCHVTVTVTVTDTVRLCSCRWSSTVAVSRRARVHADQQITLTSDAFYRAALLLLWAVPCTLQQRCFCPSARLSRSTCTASKPLFIYHTLSSPFTVYLHTDIQKSLVSKNMCLLSVSPHSCDCCSPPRWMGWVALRIPSPGGYHVEFGS